MSRQLVRLADDVPIALDWDAWKLRDFGCRPAARPCSANGASARFADQVRQMAAGARCGGAVVVSAAVEDERCRGPGRIVPFGANAGPSRLASRLITWWTRRRSSRRSESNLQKQKRFAVDLETTSLEPRRAEIVGLAFSWQAGEAWYLAVRGPAGEPVLDPATTLERCGRCSKTRRWPRSIRTSSTICWCCGSRASSCTAWPAIRWWPITSCTPASAAITWTTWRSRYLNHQVIPITDLIGKKGKNQLRMDQVPTAQVAEYSGEDADVAWRLCGPARSRSSARAAACKKLYDDLEIPLIEVLAELEFNGIRLDVPLLERHRPGDGAAAGGHREGDLRAGGPRIQHRLAQAAPAGVVRRTEAADAAQDRHHRRGQHRSGDAGTAGGAGPRVAAEDPRTPPDRQAEGHLRRCPAGAGESRRRAGFTPRSTRRWPRRAGSVVQRPEPAKHPDPHASRAGRSARRSCPRKAGCC